MKVTTNRYGPGAAMHNANVAKQTHTVAQEGRPAGQRAAIDPLLGEAQSRLAALPDMDMGRVNEIKDAISSGKIAIDLDALTDAMQKYYQR